MTELKPERDDFFKVAKGICSDTMSRSICKDCPRAGVFRCCPGLDGTCDIKSELVAAEFKQKSSADIYEDWLAKKSVECEQNASCEFRDGCIIIEFDQQNLGCAAAYAARFPNNFFEVRGIKPDDIKPEDNNLVEAWLLESKSAWEMIIRIARRRGCGNLPDERIGSKQTLTKKCGAYFLEIEI